MRWDWVTSADAAGGVFDAPLNALAYSRSGTLFAGTPNSLNVVQHGTGYEFRISGLQGLPTGNITSIAVRTAVGAGGAGKSGVARNEEAEEEEEEEEVWIGTAKGLIVMRWNASTDSMIGHPSYLYGPRWHPGEAVSSNGMLALPPPSPSSSFSSPIIIIKVDFSSSSTGRHAGRY